MKLAGGLVQIAVVGGEETLYSSRLACPDCGINVPQLEPRSFSFNSAYGACPECHGLGSKYDFDPAKIITDWSKPLLDGGLGPGSASQNLLNQVRLVAEAYGINLATPFEKLPDKIQTLLLYGEPDRGGKTGYRGILVTRFVDELPENLPPNVHGFSYIPFSLLLPRCAALVHAGGIGNISQAFAAGIPQIVMPLLNDQPDNAVRVQRLGAGLTIQPADYRSRNVAELLNKLHKDPSYRSRAHEFQQKMQNHNGLLRACELIEQAINR